MVQVAKPALFDGGQMKIQLLIAQSLKPHIKNGHLG